MMNTGRLEIEMMRRREDKRMKAQEIEKKVKLEKLEGEWLLLALLISFYIHFTIFTAENERLRLHEAELDNNIAELLTTYNNLLNDRKICKTCSKDEYE